MINGWGCDKRPRNKDIDNTEPEIFNLKRFGFSDKIYVMDITQLLGYAASFIIFIALVMKSIVKLRILTAIGCLLFVIFAFKTDSWPAVVMNIGIVFIDIYYLYKMMQVKDSFEMLAVNKDNEIIKFFFEKHKQELTALFGNEAFTKAEKTAICFRNNDIAGLIAYTVTAADAGKTANLLIDFVVPNARDLAVGKHLFIEDQSFWKQQGVTTVTVEKPSAAHIRYLEQLGFTRAGGSDVWSKPV